ncbi:MAG: 5-formyltetrahydrofolate cyclo-ligase [Pseudomonadota bacterium]
MSGAALAARKAVLRKAAYARRKQAHTEADHAGPAATARLVSLLRSRSDLGIVAGYLPIRTEIDPRPAMTALSEDGRKICVPIVEGRAQPLGFRRWTPGAALQEGAFGAMVPLAGEACVPTTLIVPLLAFDAGCGRLGYGGGYYDRTLATLARNGPVFSVGFAYAAQEVDALPLAATDIRLDAVVTDAGVRGAA